LAGVHTAEGRYDPASAAHQQARTGHRWRDDPQGSDYIAVVPLQRATVPAQVAIRSLLPADHFHLRGLSLIDSETGTSRNLSIDPNYQLVHSGDVKIYENTSVLPRAFVLHRATLSPSDTDTLRLLQEPATHPGQELILSSGQSLTGSSDPTLVDLIVYEPERVLVRAELDAPGYLFLADAYYPGWEATVDGQPAPIHRANLYFRAVAVPPGSHEVEFHYQPASVTFGLALTAVSWLIWVPLTLVLAAIGYRIGRKRSSGV
jgi:hypothetical protein